ncbi:SCO family protein [Nocardiopsis sp. JB363]|uniref:SCO family protein n=1 Tax=Nocardiopsis sp. JB363 TaxID=1434837 RepID=UPI000B350CD5|nr:SCO family protein [Nocardiopsis sp. JB363]
MTATKTLLAALGLALLTSLTACASDDPVSGAEYYMDLSDQPMSASTIELETLDGQPWSFGDVAADRLTLLFFGYTSCPDVCPMTMADINLALEEAGETARSYDVAMVTTDPARDTPEQLRGWIDRFDPSFHGVRGDIDATVQAAQDYGIPVEPPQEVEGQYLVTHGGRVIVLLPGGEAAGMFDEGTEAADIAALLPALAQDLL